MLLGGSSLNHLKTFIICSEMFSSSLQIDHETKPFDEVFFVDLLKDFSVKSYRKSRGKNWCRLEFLNIKHLPTALTSLCLYVA